MYMLNDRRLIIPRAGDGGLRSRARVIGDVDVDAGNTTVVAQAGTDVGSTDVEEMWTQSSSGVLADIRDALGDGGAKQERKDHRVTLD